MMKKSLAAVSHDHKKRLQFSDTYAYFEWIFGILDDTLRCGSNLDGRTAFDIVEGLLKLNKRKYHLKMNFCLCSDINYVFNMMFA